MSVAMIKGLQGENPKYWLTAALLKHFFANSNEDARTRTSSDFDERQFYEYYSLPFHMGFVEGGARCFMTTRRTGLGNEAVVVGLPHLTGQMLVCFAGAVANEPFLAASHWYFFPARKAMMIKCPTTVE